MFIEPFIVSSPTSNRIPSGMILAFIVFVVGQTYYPTAVLPLIIAVLVGAGVGWIVGDALRNASGIKDAIIPGASLIVLVLGQIPAIRKAVADASIGSFFGDATTVYELQCASVAFIVFVIIAYCMVTPAKKSA